MNSNTLSAITVIALIVALAIGLIVYVVTDYGLIIILWVTLMIFGGAYGTLAMFSPKESGKYGPAPFINNLIIGEIILMVGMIGLLYTISDVDPIILIAAFLVMLAGAIGSLVYFNYIYGKKRESQ
ncbi:MAG: hypothetical protein FWC44_02360 [Methanomassiliicoccaceae archaeon]|nr:hypothetical protein [Methanomassiliicoccaceae archaeon]